MEENKNIQNEVEKTLNALKDATVPEANPFLYTRLMNEIKNREGGNEKSKLNISPAYSLMMALLIVLNIFSVIYYVGTDNTETDYRTEYITELADEYSINYKSEF